LLLLAAVDAAADGRTAAYAGRQVASVIDEFREAGIEFAYSTNVVTDDLYVAFEPEPGTPLEIVRQVLRPHGLSVREEAGVFVIVRDDAPAVPDVEPTIAETPPRPDIETVVVAASRYEISRDIAASRFSLDRRTIQNMPDIGEDPIRVTQRLPGTAASGASARTHFRGGEENEIGIMLNGQWLFDPFHIRDYQNVFSAIDARAIDGVEVYTGGFPVRYGDRMSGLVLMDALEPEESRHNEIGISVFNTSLLTAGSGNGRNWVFSARRGNLDLVIDPKFGSPSYFDVFGEFALDVGPNARLSINALYADDQVQLVLETDPEEREQVTSDTQNVQLWLRLDSDWSPNLASRTVLSFVDYANRRDGVANDPAKLVASVRDDRDVRQVGLHQDWIWSPSERHRAQWGVHVRYDEAKFSYAGSAQYFGLQELFGRPAVNRMIAAQPNGGSYAFYFSDRWRVSDRAMLEWGLRWDDQSYTELGSDSQLSPRLSYMFRPWEDSEFRVSLGRYHQSQPIQSLQIEDGITGPHNVRTSSSSDSASFSVAMSRCGRRSFTRRFARCGRVSKTCTTPSASCPSCRPTV
jgi:outer membrane receptor protein involved in Fe transport